MFKALTGFDEWAEIEQARIKRWGDSVGKKPWKGSFRFIDEKGKEYTTLEYNKQTGHSTEQR